MKLQTIYSSPCAQHSYDEANNMLVSTWLQATKGMGYTDFEHEMQARLAVSEQVKPRLIYDYCVDFLYPITPKEQIWMARLLNPGWIALGVQKYAHIVPKELIANLSVEQSFDEFLQMNLPGQFAIRHFAKEDADQARAWLLA